MLDYCHGNGLGDKLVAKGSSRVSIQLLGHNGNLAEVASSLCVFAFDLVD